MYKVRMKSKPLITTKQGDEEIAAALKIKSKPWIGFTEQAEILMLISHSLNPIMITNSCFLISCFIFN
jgi:hypothetical protein